MYKKPSDLWLPSYYNLITSQVETVEEETQHVAFLKVILYLILNHAQGDSSLGFSTYGYL